MEGGVEATEEECCEVLGGGDGELEEGLMAGFGNSLGRCMVGYGGRL